MLTITEFTPADVASDVTFIAASLNNASSVEAFNDLLALVKHAIAGAPASDAVRALRFALDIYSAE